MRVADFFESYKVPMEERGKQVSKLRVRNTCLAPRRITRLMSCAHSQDWPSTAEFRVQFPDLFVDFSNALPFPDYTRRDGVYNVTSHVSLAGGGSIRLVLMCAPCLFASSPATHLALTSVPRCTTHS